MQPVGLKSNVMRGNGAGVEGDEKFWGAVAAVVAQVAPTIIEEITKNYQPTAQPAPQPAAQKFGFTLSSEQRALIDNMLANSVGAGAY